MPTARGAHTLAFDPSRHRLYAFLPGGITLLVPGRLHAHDIPAVHAAARPLLDLLAERLAVHGQPSDRR